MFKTYAAAALVESSIFQAFQFTLEAGGDGKVEANVGTARKFNGTVQLGWASGRATGDLVQPYTNHVHNCHGTSRDMKKRGYTNDELKDIVAGLTAYAFKDAAKEAYPTLKAAAAPLEAALLGVAQPAFREIPLVTAVEADAPNTAISFCGCSGDCAGALCPQVARAAKDCGAATQHGIAAGEACSKVCATLNAQAHGLVTFSGCTGTFNPNGAGEADEEK